MDSAGAIILGLSLIIIMLGMGLSLVPNDFKRVFTQPKAILTGLFNQIILLPIIAYLLCTSLPVSFEVAIGIMILASCPGGPTSNLITHLADADLPLSISLTVVCSLITLFTIPIIINWSLQEFAQNSHIIKLDFIDSVIKIAAIIIIPTAIGMVINNFFPSFAEKMKKPVKLMSAFVFVLVILGIILKERVHLVDYFQQAGIIALLLNICTLSSGYFISQLLIKDRKKSITISIESGIQNGTLAINIAVVLLANSNFAIAPAVYSVIMFFSCGLLISLGMKKNKKQSILNNPN